LQHDVFGTPRTLWLVVENGGLWLLWHRQDSRGRKRCAASTRSEADVCTRRGPRGGSSYRGPRVGSGPARLRLRLRGASIGGPGGRPININIKIKSTTSTSEVVQLPVAVSVRGHRGGRHVGGGVVVIHQVLPRRVVRLGCGPGAGLLAAKNMGAMGVRRRSSGRGRLLVLL